MDSNQIQKLHNILPYFMGCECMYEDTEGKVSTGVITLSLLSDFKIEPLRQKGKKYIIKIVPYVRSFNNLTIDHIKDIALIGLDYPEEECIWSFSSEKDSLGIIFTYIAVCQFNREGENLSFSTRIDSNFNISTSTLNSDKILVPIIRANQVETILYLISTYFDIFQLRAAGLAKEVFDKTEYINKIKEGK